jgi:hypothetical protein
MGEIWTKQFWFAALERAIKSFAGGLLAAFGTNVTNIYSVDWQQALGFAAFTSVSSILLSIVSAGVGNSGPSLGPEQLKGGN